MHWRGCLGMDIHHPNIHRLQPLQHFGCCPGNGKCPLPKTALLDACVCSFLSEEQELFMCLTSFPCWLLFLEHLVLLCHIFNFSFFFLLQFFQKVSQVSCESCHLLWWTDRELSPESTVSFCFDSSLVTFRSSLQPSTVNLQLSLFLSSLMGAFIIDMKQTVQWKSPDKPTVNFLPRKKANKVSE